MSSREIKRSFKGGCARENGFSLLEMVLATAILLVGVLSVVQLVPASLKSNLYNRMDTMATTVAQQELDQMLVQPLGPPYTFTDTAGNVISLGDPSQPGVVVGSPVIMQGALATIDFSADKVSGYNIQKYQDFKDPTASSYELRWAVITATTTTTNGAIVSRRIIIGCRQTNAAQPMLPVNLDSSVQN
jgi:prepilin-type N-terminal cleavage/methylation domain-containing protein